MTISTYYNGINWLATAQFTSDTYDFMEEFDYTGVSFDSPELATIDLLSNLSELTQIKLINRPEEDLNYRPLTWYSELVKLWYCQIDVIDWHGHVQYLSRVGASPEEALSRLFETAINRGVHVASEQAREAQDLFTV
jgi:hypothetical protein